MAKVSHIPHTLTERAALDFCNSRFTDHLGSGQVYDRLVFPEWWDWFTRRWRLGPVPAGPPPLERARAARVVIRSCLESGGKPDPAGRTALNDLMALSPTVPRLSESGELLAEPAGRDWNWVLAAVGTSAAEVIASGDWKRVKVCANPACSFLFFDVSQNRTRRWCDPAICGNLVKVRRFRSRAMAGGPG